MPVKWEEQRTWGKPGQGAWWGQSERNSGDDCADPGYRTSAGKGGPVNQDQPY